MRQERGIWVDLALAAALTAVGASMTIGPDGAGGTVIDTLVIPTVTLPLIWRQRDPVAASVAVAAGLVLSGLPTFDQTRCGVAIPAALLIVFSVAARQGRPRALAGLAAVQGGLVVLLLTDPLLGAGAAFVPPLAAGVWGAGRLVRARTQVAGELAESTRELERTREETAQLAVEVERARLAAEIDVAARERIRSVVDLASIGEQDVQQSAATSRLAFQRIETEGRESLNEVRELLGVLRSDGCDTSPRPTLAQLEPLLQQARIGGGPVGLGVEGRRRPLPAGVELAAYRMVQHALEAFAEADGGPAGVRLRYLRTSLELEVDGSMPRGDAVVALAAARERVTAHGGSFSARRQGSGRLLVQAQLPLATSGA
jgi:signal transduction histidine kinase